jgi:hypothetical protein
LVALVRAPSALFGVHGIIIGAILTTFLICVLRQSGTPWRCSWLRPASAVERLVSDSYACNHTILEIPCENGAKIG